MSKKPKIRKPKIEFMESQDEFRQRISDFIEETAFGQITILIEDGEITSVELIPKQRLRKKNNGSN